MMTSISACVLLLAVGCCVLTVASLAGSAEEAAPGPQAVTGSGPASVTDAEVTEAKQIFAAQCGWCHGSYGMTPDKGPRLAGTQMTEREVQERIRNGKPGYMPSFHRFLNEQQITLMARYIKSLKPAE